MNSQPTYKVCVWCITYNHAPYITETMEGFCRQQTKFPYVCTIFDDASTDGEPEVIRQYLHDHFITEETKDTDDYRLTIARHQENRNCYFAVFLLKYNHHSRNKSRRAYYKDLIAGVDYVAFCEGDDYWTDALKLQKQADALDANPKAMLAYTSFRIIDSEGKPLSRPVIESFPGRSHSGDNLPTLLHHGNYVMTLTTMYRMEVWFSDFFMDCPYKMDFSLTLSAALMGDFIWMPEQTACYRSLESGMIMSNHQKVVQAANKIYRYFARLVMQKRCKPLSFRQRLGLITLIIRRALKINDVQLLKDTLRSSLLSYLLLPLAYIKVKTENMKLRTGETKRR